MMSLAQIHRMSEEMGRKAARQHKQPLEIWEGDIASQIRHIPNIGNHRPRDWELVDTHFVDTSGFGQPGEPALTFNQFVAKVVVGHAYAIVEEGQFQCYIGEFVPIRTDRKQKRKVHP